MSDTDPTPSTPQAGRGSAAGRDPRLVIEVVPENLPAVCAEHLAGLIRRTLEEQERCVVALSGGSTPVPMCRQLFTADLDWSRVVIVQVDERVAPAGDDDRNWTAIEATLKDTPALDATLLPMPVESADLEHAAQRYGDSLREFAGEPPVIDVVQLGLGADGHTASLVPDDAVLDVADADVALTESEYEGRRRMTLTYPTINRARHRFWMVSGAGKADALQGMVRRDATLPASRIDQDAVVFVDPPAAGKDDD